MRKKWLQMIVTRTIFPIHMFWVLVFFSFWLIVNIECGGFYYSITNSNLSFETENKLTNKFVLSIVKICHELFQWTKKKNGATEERQNWISSQQLTMDKKVEKRSDIVRCFTAMTLEASMFWVCWSYKLNCVWYTKDRFYLFTNVVWGHTKMHYSIAADRPK